MVLPQISQEQSAEAVAVHGDGPLADSALGSWEQILGLMERVAEVAGFGERGVADWHMGLAADLISYGSRGDLPAKAERAAYLVAVAAAVAAVVVAVVAAAVSAAADTVAVSFGS